MLMLCTARKPGKLLRAITHHRDSTCVPDNVFLEISVTQEEVSEGSRCQLIEANAQIINLETHPNEKETI